MSMPANVLSFIIGWHLRREAPLFRAIFSNSYEFLKLLIQHADDCTNVTIHCKTVLHYTAQYENVKIASILASARLEHINPVAADFNGMAASQAFSQCLVTPEGFEGAFEKLLEGIRDSQSTDSKDFESYGDS